jgi:DNA-binding transcriptional LysR family regulator
MRLDKIDLNLFIVFDALYRERSVTRVALTLNLTQPGVSNALNRLRQTFDDPLFVRSPDGMLPTPVADSIVADIRKGLALLRRTVGSNAHFNPLTAEKTFRLAMNDLTESMLLSPIQARLKSQAPHINLTSYYADSRVATEDLKSNAIDLLIDSQQVNAKELVSMPLLELPYVVVMRADHPLASNPFTLEQYLSAEHLHVSSRRKGRGHVDIALHSIGHRRNIKMRVQSYMIAEKVTEQNDLIWTAPDIPGNAGGLHKVPLPFEVEPLKLYLYWHKSADDDPANQWMRELVNNVAVDPESAQS